MVRKAAVIENSAGEPYGNGALPFGLPITASYTAGDRIVRPAEASRPTKPPTKAPLVVQSFHITDISSTGKLAEQAIAKASMTMYATFCFSKAIPRRIATTAR